MYRIGSSTNIEAYNGIIRSCEMNSVVQVSM